jgi:hypothetical protein
MCRKKLYLIRLFVSVLHKLLILGHALNIKYIGGLKMKLDDVVEISLVARIPRNRINLSGKLPL